MKASQETISGKSQVPTDDRWLQSRLDSLLQRLTNLEASVNEIGQNVSASNSHKNQTIDREYYSVQEFAALVSRGEYTVREWCRHERINAEKCETGRGEAKNWKISVEELQRYKDHGLLPLRYLR